MASVSREPSGLWRARFRTPEGRSRSRSFARKGDAERFLTSVESSKSRGAYVDARLAQVRVGPWAERWLTGRGDLKPATRERYAGILREHVLPRWGATRLCDVRHAEVQRWVTDLAAARSPATVRKVCGVLSLVLDLAVRDDRLAKNPAAGVALPRVAVTERRYLTHGQVEQLAEACAAPEQVSKHRRPDEYRSDEYRLLTLVLAYTGVRFGEAAALRVRRLDLMRRRATIAESVTVVQGQGQVWGSPKGHEHRDVPIPRFLIDELAAHVAGKQPGDLVFAGVRGGGALRVAVFRSAGFDRAAAAIGMPGLHPHELRHTAAALAIAGGANVKVVQQMLGHKSATMTLDQYGHLFGDQLDDVADRMDAGRAAAVARPVPDAAVLDLGAARRDSAHG